MALPDGLSPETLNIIAASAAAAVAGAIGMINYLRKDKSAGGANGDRVIPGITIADMQPIRDLAVEQGRTTAANTRIAEAAEGLLSLLTAQAKDDEIEDEVERRLRQRLDDRRQRTTRAPRRTAP